jgi:hypothetical protein
LGLSGSSQFGSWYAAGAKPVCMVLSLAIGEMPVSSVGFAIGGMPVSSIGFGYRWVPVSIGQFGYRCDSCELVALGYRWVAKVQRHA